MPQCSASEAAALNSSGPLLLFAAQHVEKLDPDLSLAIAEARVAQEKSEWTPQISQRFWSAYAKLCDLIEPTTIECLTVAQQNIARRKWLGLGAMEKVSLAERTSSLYATVLIVLLIPLLLLQLYVWICTTQSKQIDDLMPQYKAQFTALTDEYTKLGAATANIKSEDWTSDQVASAAKISTDAAALNEQGESIRYSAILLGENFLGQASSLFAAPQRTAAAETQSNKQWYEDYHEAASRADNLLSIVPKVQARTNLIVGIFVSFVLPILFATIGAIAYVIRTISDQINKTTFSPTSPIRHVMRVILGALAGVVVGLFTGLTTQFSLPPLAIAFLAGYGVEAVFSMFDGLIQKFR